MSPGQAYAVGYLANLWLKFYPRVESAFRQDALFQQILPTLVDADAAAAAEREQDEMPPPVQSSVAVAMHQPLPPFPVEIDEYASTAAPPPPRSAAEAKAQFDARLAATPTPLYPDPVTGRLLTPNELLETDPAFIAMRQRELAGATSLPGAQVAQAFQPVLPPEVTEMQKRSHSNASESALPASEISDLRSVISALSRSSKRQRNGQPSALHKTIIETVLKQIFAGSNRDP